jgi:homoserine kinase
MNLAVRVPATSANLGPGFDVFGMALSLFATVSLGPIDDAELVSAGHPAMQAFVRAGGIGQVWVDSPIPSGRGLGFSGAVRVGGIVLGLAQKYSIGSDQLNVYIAEHRDEIIGIAAELEGHYDNVAASVIGGIVVASPESTVAVPVADSFIDQVRVVAWVPFFQTSTDSSRSTLKSEVERADAVFNIACASQMVIALTTGDLDLLRISMADRLHQDQRLHDTPMCREVMDRFVEVGAITSWLSGSGPTVAAFVEKDLAHEIAGILNREFSEGHTKVLGIDCQGARNALV